MTEVGQDRDANPNALQRLLAGVPKLRGAAPVHLWHPDYCGEIDMRIAADGTWHYNGSPIARITMVKLFATILRKDPERFVLVTPVERIGITVEDAPFIAVEMDTEDAERAPRMFVRTNLDDVVEIGPDHPLRFETATDGGLKPYVHVRGDLWALASRSLTHELIGKGNVQQHGSPPKLWFGITSGKHFFPICPEDEIIPGHDP